MYTWPNLHLKILKWFSLSQCKCPDIMLNGLDVLDSLFWYFGNDAFYVWLGEFEGCWWPLVELFRVWSYCCISLSTDIIDHSSNDLGYINWWTWRRAIRLRFAFQVQDHVELDGCNVFQDKLRSEGIMTLSSSACRKSNYFIEILTGLTRNRCRRHK